MGSDGFLEASDNPAGMNHEDGVIASADRRRWSIALLLGLGVLVNYFDRVNLTVSHDALVSEFRISDVTFGLSAGGVQLDLRAMPASVGCPAGPVSECGAWVASAR